jgi:hypothetical protein
LKREETVPEDARAAVEDLLLGSTARPAPKAAIRKAVNSKVLVREEADGRGPRAAKKSDKVERLSKPQIASFIPVVRSIAYSPIAL